MEALASEKGNGKRETGVLGGKGNFYLGLDEFSVFVFLFGEFGVDVFDDTFEGGELHHCVGNLTTPKRLQALVQSTNHRQSP
jgi:hypothetical protein